MVLEVQSFCNKSVKENAGGNPDLKKNSFTVRWMNEQGEKESKRKVKKVVHKDVKSGALAGSMSVSIFI